MIYQTIDNASQFRDAFRDAGRAEQFSYEAMELLYDYLEDSGEDYELDVIALCCEFYESDAAEIVDNYRLDVECMDEDEVKEAVEDYLKDNTLLVGITVAGGFVYAAF
jgi:hypothetical protein